MWKEPQPNSVIRNPLKENEEIIDYANVKQNDEDNVQHEDLNQENCFSLNFKDYGNWKDVRIDQKIRDFMVEIGPKKIDYILFPKDNQGRHFDSSQYKRLLANGQTTDRRWLVYSISLDKIFCFYCKLISPIVTKVKHAKYSSVILDCTPHASHEKQMSLVIRCMDDSINSSMLNIDNIRGQGYDNGANMSERHKGAQKKKIFKDKVEGLTLKLLSQTRWKSHVESIKSIKEQSVQIRDALLDLANIIEDPKTKSKAEFLAIYELENFEFLLSMVIWYKLLQAINTVSNFFQVENMDIDEAIKFLQAHILFLKKYRESRFASAIKDAKQISSEMGIEAVFGEKMHHLKEDVVR
ncbi:uncharacterized protein LOC111394258 [Olea europaea var. sylvestris]|uniref:uncharacterized protein LOC111394258 n=1 Tax=Olea europaea var. sylvestris TaxID=158386 RepID=UPI000C1D8863|nr:uncharacterized protein LOC111394258 [Olea europaea var. sylvestris]